MTETLKHTLHLLTETFLRVADNNSTLYHVVKNNTYSKAQDNV